jgi:hypothetical protein
MKLTCGQLTNSIEADRMIRSTGRYYLNSASGKYGTAGNNKEDN